MTLDELCGDWATNQWWFWYLIALHSLALVGGGAALLQWRGRKR